MDEIFIICFHKLRNMTLTLVKDKSTYWVNISFVLVNQVLDSAMEGQWRTPSCCKRDMAEDPIIYRYSAIFYNEKLYYAHEHFQWNGTRQIWNTENWMVCIGRPTSK